MDAWNHSTHQDRLVMITSVVFKQNSLFFLMQLKEILMIPG